MLLQQIPTIKNSEHIQKYKSKRYFMKYIKITQQILFCTGLFLLKIYLKKINEMRSNLLFN